MILRMEIKIVGIVYKPHIITIAHTYWYRMMWYIISHMFINLFKIEVSIGEMVIIYDIDKEVLIITLNHIIFDIIIIIIYTLYNTFFHFHHP